MATEQQVLNIIQGIMSNPNIRPISLTTSEIRTIVSIAVEIAQETNKALSAK
jgi:hypothetical protein